MTEPQDEANRAARLLRLMQRDGSALPLMDECDVARGLVARGFAEWSGPLTIVLTTKGRAMAEALS